MTTLPLSSDDIKVVFAITANCPPHLRDISMRVHDEFVILPLWERTWEKLREIESKYYAVFEE
jgi:hypothetical protein